MSVMNTFSGRKFDPMQMNVEDVSLEDISHALSLMGRGGGHLKYFYSVGQHSINCMKEAAARGWPKRIQLACLLHDASEAYIADIIRPVKVHLPEYYNIENKIMACILEKFGLGDLSEEENSRWKQIDDEILDHELRELMIGEKDRIVKPLASVPDMTERKWRDVAEEFKTLAESLIKEKQTMKIAEIMKKMIAFSNGNIHDINHLMCVWTYAKTIGELENLDPETQYILEVAAITHDIACPFCREKYGNTNGKYQEKEGIPIVKEFLSDTGMCEAQIERVAYLVGHHHTLTDIEGIDYQILIEADYIVNAYESNYSKENIENFIEKIMKTDSGKAIIKEVFCL